MATQYYIAQSDHVETLEEQVNERLKQGWELQGGVSACVTKNSLTPKTNPNIGDEL
jgi:hypothetical protein